jgi:hypothetical protein
MMRYLLPCILAATVTVAAESRWQQIEPLIDGHTLAVAWGDPGTIDVRGLVERFAAQAKQDGLDLPASFLDGLEPVLSTIEAQQEVYRSAGGRTLIAASSMTDYTTPSPLPRLAVVTTPDADRAALERLLRGLLVAAYGPEVKLAWQDGLLVVRPAEREAIADDALAQVERPALAAAIQAADEALLNVVIALPPYGRRVVAENLLDVPAGEGAETAYLLGEQVRSVAVSLGGAPDYKLSVVARTSSAAAAATLRTLCQRWQALIPDDPGLFGWARMLRELDPQQADATLRLEAKTGEFAPMIALALIEAREQAVRNVAMSQARQLVLSAAVYAANHKNTWPETLAILVAEEYIAPEQLRSEQGREFVYVPPVAGENPSHTVVIYEQFAAWPTDGLVVGFMDGHVQVVRDEARFEELLATTRAANEKARKERQNAADGAR